MSFSRAGLAVSLLELLERSQVFQEFCPGSRAEGGDVIPAQHVEVSRFTAVNSKHLEAGFEVSRWRGGGSRAVGGREGRLQPGIQLCLPHSEHISSLFPSFDEGTAEFTSQQALEEGGKSEGSCSRSCLRGLRGAGQET